jgi:hypothetical protein
MLSTAHPLQLGMAEGEVLNDDNRLAFPDLPKRNMNPIVGAGKSNVAMRISH